jgi:ApaG protein
MMNLVFRQTTGDFVVCVQPHYLEAESRPSEQSYAWAYTVSIENHSGRPAQLKRRTWKIVDANGFIQEVDGEGVVGQQPIIKSGECYEYTSMTNLLTRSGLMVGTYEMESETGEKFSVAIPAFSLDSPEQLSLPN